MFHSIAGVFRFYFTTFFESSTESSNFKTFHHSLSPFLTSKRPQFHHLRPNQKLIVRFFSLFANCFFFFFAGSKKNIFIRKISTHLIQSTLRLVRQYEYFPFCVISYNVYALNPRDIKQAWLSYQFFFHTNSKQTTAYFVITPQYYRICALSDELPRIWALFRVEFTGQTTKFSIIHDDTVPSVISLRMIKFLRWLLL